MVQGTSTSTYPQVLKGTVLELLTGSSPLGPCSERFHSVLLLPILPLPKLPDKASHFNLVDNWEIMSGKRVYLGILMASQKTKANTQVTIIK